MDCIEFVGSRRFTCVPIVECGGIILAEGERLVVRRDIAKRMQDRYKDYSLEQKEVKKEKLRNGYFEVVGSKKPATLKDRIKTVDIKKEAPVVIEKEVDLGSNDA